jgi:hypothetical protein
LMENIASHPLPEQLSDQPRLAQSGAHRHAGA